MSKLPGTTDQGDVYPRSHLFTVRLWLEQLGEGRTEWRGKIRHVSSGTVGYFREWQTLVILIQKMLPNQDVYERNHPPVGEQRE